MNKIVKQLLVNVVSWAIIGFIIGSIIFLLTPRQYTSSVFLAEQTDSTLVDKYKTLISTNTFQADIKQMTGRKYSDIVGTQVNLVHATGSSVFQLKAVSSTADKSKYTLNVYSNNLVNNLHKYYSQGNINVISSVSFSNNFTLNNFLTDGIFGLIVGSIIGLMFVSLRLLLIGKADLQWSRFIFGRKNLGVISIVRGNQE